MQAIAPVVEAVLTRRGSHPPSMALLVGLSGIDGSGKGYLAGQLVQALTTCGLETAAINVDGWLNLPAIRFDRYDRPKTSTKTPCDSTRCSLGWCCRCERIAVPT